MVILDSDILIGVLRENQEAVRFVNSIGEKGEKLNITVINGFELMEGAMLFADQEKIDKTENFLMSFNFYNFDNNASWKAAEISSELKKKGELIDFQDIVIAAIAIMHGEKLATRNTGHFRRIKELKIEKW